MKDYYATLGVTRQAEDVVIRAAYKALAQRYHPDRFSGSKDEANRRMADINEAYAILSDPKRKQQYDGEYDSSVSSAGQGYDEDDEAADDAVAQLAADWEVATEFYPDLVNLEKELSTTSKRLALTYRLVILSKKDFKNRSLVAEKLHATFLESYFGRNEEILAYAKKLISLGQRSAAKALNRAISVLGDEAEPKKIIDTINIKFNLVSIVRLTLERELAEGKAQFLVNSPQAIAFYKAIKASDVPTIRRLLIDEPLLVGLRDGSNGNTPLQTAIAERDAAIALCLIEAGSPLKWTNLFGATPLEFASKEASMSAVAESIKLRM